MKLMDTYKGIAQVTIGIGDTILSGRIYRMVEFWNMLTHNSTLTLSMAILALTQFSAKNLFRIYFDYHYLKKLSCNFYELKIFLQPLRDDTNPDTWSYIWGNKTYSSQKAYKHLMGSNRVHPAFKMDMEIIVPAEAQSVLLASFEKQHEYKRFIKKEKYDCE
jgi:hypothetical protein